MGITVLLGLSSSRILGNGRAEGVEFKGGGSIPADLVVIAAGIRPNITLAQKAGLAVKRGIVVNDYMETSHPDIFAVGECVQHNGVCYGLVAPLIEQAKVLAATITGNKGPKYEGSVQAAKLKIMGVDVFSAGEIGEKLDGSEVIRYEDPSLGVYKRLTIKNNRLAGVILIGETKDSPRYMEWLRAQTDLASQRRQLLFPGPEEDGGGEIAALSDKETVCGCMGVTKGTIIHAIHEKGIRTLAQLKESTRASTGCGSCTSLCHELLKAVAPEFQEEVKKTICKCIPFPEDNLREILRSQRLKSVQEVLEIYGNGVGCEVCKPALSYMLDMLWCGEHDEDRSARFINDRVHANIQKDGTFSVVPRIRGGVTSPDELRRIADAAEKYRVRMVKTCVGTDFCRFGVQDSTRAGIELERRFENLYTPHKLKMGAAGCPRNCAEATVKDIGLVGQEGSWQVVVGGAAGKKVRKADLLITVETTREALDAAGLFFQYYREKANYLERTYDFVERVGIEKVRKETVYAPEAVKEGLRDRLSKSKERSRDAWLERDRPKHPTQFVQITPLEEVLA
jgi:nitrite reductase (NADH) large subunit